MITEEISGVTGRMVGFTKEVYGVTGNTGTNSETISGVKEETGKIAGKASGITGDSGGNTKRIYDCRVKFDGITDHIMFQGPITATDILPSLSGKEIPADHSVGAAEEKATGDSFTGP